MDNEQGVTTNISSPTENTANDVATTSNDARFKIDVPQVVPTDLVDDEPSQQSVMNLRDDLESDIRRQLEEQRRLQQEALEASQETDRERSLNRELDALSVAEQQALLNEENRPVALEFTTGRQREIQRQAALDRLAASTQLRQEQQARQSKLTTIGQRLGIVSNSLESLLGLTEEFAGLEKQQREDTRDALVTMMDFSNGKTFDELDPQSQNALIDLTSRLPITLGAVKNALNANKVALEEQQKQAMYQASLDQVKLQNEILKGQKTMADINKIEKSLMASPRAAAIKEDNFEHFRKVQLAFSRIPTQLKNSEAEREYFIQGIEQGLGEGYSPLEIADIVSGFNVDDAKRDDPFTVNMRDLMSQMDLSNTQLSEVARLINMGNRERVVRRVENELLEQAQNIDPDGFISEARVLTTLQLGQEVAETLNAAKGVIAGKGDRIIGKLKGRDAAKLQGALTQMSVRMRQEIMGSDMTKEERRLLEPLIPSLDDRVSVVIDKVNRLNAVPLQTYNSFRLQAGLPPVDRTSLWDMNARANLYGSSGFTSSQVESAASRAPATVQIQQTESEETPTDISDLNFRF